MYTYKYVYIYISLSLSLSPVSGPHMVRSPKELEWNGFASDGDAAPALQLQKITYSTQAADCRPAVVTKSRQKHELA